MGKQDLIKELTQLGVVFNEKQSILELQALLSRAKGTKTGMTGLKPKKDPMANISTLRKSVLQNIFAFLQVPVSKKLTKGELLLTLREELPNIQVEKMTVGKYKGCQMQDAVQDVNYMTWILKEESLSCSQMNKLKMLARLSFVGQIPEDFGDEDESGLKESKAEVKKETKDEPKVRVKKEAVKPSTSSKTPAEIPIHTSEEEEEDDESEPEKKMKSSGSDTATSWMELGEKRKHHKDRREKKV